jgi:hypothetical protein
MKTPKLCSIVSTVMMLLLIAASAGPLSAKTERPKAKAASSQPSAGGTSAPADPIATFQNSTAWKKLDGPTQQAWLDAMQSGDTKRRMDCFVRVDAPADRGDVSFLESNGYDVRMFAGPIATGHMNAEDLPNVAGLPFVRSVRLSK